MARTRGGEPEGFGPRLRAAREAAGLTQTGLAGDGLSPSYVSHLESGRRTPTPDVAATLAARLGVPVADLLGPADAGPGEQLVLAQAALGLGRPQEALDLTDRWADDTSDISRLAAEPALVELAQCRAAALERTGRLVEAAAVLEVVRAASEEAPRSVPWIAPTTSLLRLYRESGDLRRAADLGEDALARGRRAGLDAAAAPGWAALVSTVSSVYSERGDLVRALAILDDLLARLDDDAADDRAKLLWNVAITTTERGEAAEGARIVEEASRLAEGSDLGVRVRLRYTRAWVLMQQQPPRAEEARAELRELLPQARQLGGTALLGTVESELARAELVLGRPDVAHRLAAASLARLGPSQRLERAHAQLLLGSASLALGEEAAAVALLQEAAAALEEVEASRWAAVAWRSLADAFALIGDDARATAALRRALDVVHVPAVPVAPATDAARRAADRPRARSRA